jgi:predicted extracellular nuclease
MPLVRKCAAGAVMVLVVFAGLLALARPAGAVSSNLVLSQIYGGGGNTGAPYQNDYIEVFNRGASPIDTTGMSVQYTSATGTGNFGANDTLITPLSGIVSPGQYVLVQEASGGANGSPLPGPSIADATPINMSATGGKVALVNSTTGLGCNGGSTPCSAAQLALIVDLIGYDGANFFEGAAPAPTLSNTTAAFRKVNGCQDTDSNSADFVAAAPSPRTILSPTFGCGDAAPTVSMTSPSNGATGVAIGANVELTFSEPVNVSGSWYSISCGTSGSHTAAVSGGPTVFTLDPDANFAYSETCSVAVNGAQVSDQDTNDPPDNVVDTPTFSFTTAAAPQVVVSQVYGGGGNSGATSKNDFIELYNRGASAASLNGWSVQYSSATGTTWQATNLTNFTLQPGQYYLVQEAAGAGGTTNLPTPDAVGTVAMAATAGKVALVNTTTALSGACPSGASILDFVGYGSTANCFEGSGPTPAPSNTTAALRNAAGATDTNNNAADFSVGTPNPRNSQDQAPFVAASTPANGAADVAVDSNVTITFSEAVNVSGSWFSISCTTSDGHSASVSGGPTTFTLDPTANFVSAETCTVTVFAANVTDQDTQDPPDNMTANYSFSFSTVAPPVAIHDIQGASHISPKAGQNVANVNGIVTAKRSNGFYMQDPNPDADPATSEGIFVFTSSAPSSVNVGDAVKVNGKVQEFRPGGASTGNLTTTELTTPTITVLSSGNPLPAATIVGTGGRIPPNTVIEDDATGDVETSGTFDPASDGLDFWESVEGMRLELDNAVAVGPTNAFGETQVVGDDGANAGLRTARGGLLLRPTDANPERLVADDVLVPLPAMNVGDHYDAPLVGVLDYNFGNFFLEVTSSGVGAIHDGVTPETTTAAGLNQVAVSTFNFENLDPTDPQSKFDRLAGILVNNLKAPDIVSGEEVQDDNGPTDNGVVDANQTLDQLVAAIQAAGGPTYDYRYINPVNDQDGGEPGGNIRQVFLFRTDRGVSFVDRPGGGSTTPTTVVGSGASTQLSFSPGRIDPTNSAFNTSRKPLAGEFMFNGHHLFVIANHFNSKGGDQPLEGHFQPPTRSSEVQRHQQAQIVHDFVASILSADPNANVVVDGDLNDFEWSDTVSILKSGVLHDLMDTLPENERYSYVFEGNSQTLDHILTSDTLFNVPFTFDPVHVNAEFADQASDHDPSVVRITLNDPPSAGAGGPYTVAEGGSVALSASGTDLEGGPLSYAWDLDGNGTFETPGQNVTFSADDGPAAPTVKVQVTDNGGLTDVAQATVQVTNVAPTVTSLTGSPSNGLVGEGITFTGTAADPSSADTAAGFSWTFDTGSGFGAFGPNGFVATYSACGTYTVDAKARDKDGGISQPFTSPAVHVYSGSVLPPLTAGAYNVVNRGQVVPVKITVGCNGFLGGLQPAISLRAGDYDPSVDPSDPSYVVPPSGSAADTSGVMREVTADQQYIYNLAVPSNATAGSLYTILIRPFGGSSPTLYAVLKIKK